MDAIAGGEDGALKAMTTTGISASTRSKARTPISTLKMTLPQGMDRRFDGIDALLALSTGCGDYSGRRDRGLGSIRERRGRSSFMLPGQPGACHRYRSPLKAEVPLTRFVSWDR